MYLYSLKGVRETFFRVLWGRSFLLFLTFLHDMRGEPDRMTAVKIFRFFTADRKKSHGSPRIWGSHTQTLKGSVLLSIIRMYHYHQTWHRSFYAPCKGELKEEVHSPDGNLRKLQKQYLSQPANVQPKRCSVFGVSVLRQRVNQSSCPIINEIPSPNNYSTP